MVLRFFLFAVIFLFVSCTDVERDDPDDPKSNYYRGGVSPGYSSAEVPLSSVGVPSSSSSVPSSVPSSSSAPTQSGIIPGPSVTYGNETYETVVIGTQTWMARNLNYDASGSKCYNDAPANCTTYGRLYDWATAMSLPSSCNSSTCASQVGTKHKGICPSGWHIPSDAEWTTLTNFVGSSAGTKLKANSSLWSPNTGTDIYGFAALPGGLGYSDGGFDSVGGYGNFGDWWSATEYGAYLAYARGMGSSYEDVDRYSDFKDDSLYSVRCLQD